VLPLSVDIEIFTLATLIPLPVVPATFHATLSVELPSRFAGELLLVIRNAPLPVLTTWMLTSWLATPPPPDRLSH
jgi:hypothetical protein